MLSLHLFGGLQAHLDEQPLGGRAAHRKRLALLALLATATSRTMSRDKLVALLWPEYDTERGRHQLATALYDLRKAGGEELILAAGDDLRLNVAWVACDVWEFEKALCTGEREQAVKRYAGPLLDGFFLSDAPEFERWGDGERDRFARLYARALEELAAAGEAAGDFRGASLWWRNLATHDPYSSRVAFRLTRSLVAAGDRGAALQHARAHSALLRRELEIEPDSELVQLAAQLLSERHEEPAHVDDLSPVHTLNIPPAAGLQDDTGSSEDVSPEVRDHLVTVPDQARPGPGETGPGRWSFRWAALLLTGVVVVVLAIGVWTIRPMAEGKLREVDRGAATRQIDPRAHELYLRGRTAWSERSREGVEKSVVLFRQAVDQDPTYAAAWAGLADAYVILGYLGFGPPTSMFPKGKAAALRALELDHSLAAAYAPLGQALVWERDWKGAERAFQRAIELDPSYATAHQWYGLLLVPLGRMDEAVEHTRRASRLDPLSRQINNSHGMVLHYAGRSKEALWHYQQVIQAEPDSQWVRQNPWLLSNASRVYTAQEQYAEAIRLLEQALSVVPFHPRPLADLAYAYAAMGDPEKALQSFSRADTTNPQYAYFRASVFAVLSQRDSAFHWLNRVEEWSPSPLSELRMDPRMEPLRSDPRYNMLLKSLGLSATIHPKASIGHGSALSG
ncbi:hypothetical protein BH23GEM5_BH23GEM5_02210 [soil metagenome]